MCKINFHVKTQLSPDGRPALLAAAAVLRSQPAAWLGGEGELDPIAGDWPPLKLKLAIEARRAKRRCTTFENLCIGSKKIILSSAMAGSIKRPPNKIWCLNFQTFGPKEYGPKHSLIYHHNLGLSIGLHGDLWSCFFLKTVTSLRFRHIGFVVTSNFKDSPRRRALKNYFKGQPVKNLCEILKIQALLLTYYTFEALIFWTYFLFIGWENSEEYSALPQNYN